MRVTWQNLSLYLRSWENLLEALLIPLVAAAGWSQQGGSLPPPRPQLLYLQDWNKDVCSFTVVLASPKQTMRSEVPRDCGR